MPESCRHLRRVIESWDFHLRHYTGSLQGYNPRFHDCVNWKSTNQARLISPAADPCPFEELSVGSNWLHSNGFQPPMKAWIKAIYLSKTCPQRWERRGKEKKRKTDKKQRDMAEKEACPGELVSDTLTTNHHRLFFCGLPRDSTPLLVSHSFNLAAPYLRSYSSLSLLGGTCSNLYFSFSLPIIDCASPEL